MNTHLTNDTLHSDLPALSLVKPPRAVRSLVTVLAVLTLSIPILLSIVPWRQNIAVMVFDSTWGRPSPHCQAF